MEKRTLKPYHGLIGTVIVLLILLFGGPVLSHFGIWSSLVGELLIPLTGLVIILICRADIRDSVPMKLPPIKKFVASVGLYIGTIALSGAINMITSRFIPDFSSRSDGINAMVRQMPPALAIFLIAVTPAICEELFCRGFLLASLKSVKSKPVIIVTVAVIFGVLHLDLYSFLPTALIGGIFALIALETESLIIPMILHFANNALSVVSAYFLSDATEEAASTIATISVPQTIGYVLFYLGIALAFLYFSGMWFLGKKFRAKKCIAAFVTASVLTTAGYGTILLSSIELVLTKTVSFEYEDSLSKNLDLELEEGTYSFVVTATASDPVQVLLEKDGEVVLKSALEENASLQELVSLEAGTYTFRVKTADGAETQGGTVTVVIAVVKQT